MLIDWFTVGAQALNFIVLVWLMERYLYRPILKAIDAREGRIAAQLASADAKKAEAQVERDQFQKKSDEFDRQVDDLKSRAAAEADAERQRLMDEARRAADALTEQRQKALKTEAKNLNREIGHLAQREVFQIARKALADLATASLEEQLSEVFIRRLTEMDESTKTNFAAALKAASAPARVRSAFALQPEQQAAIRKALDDTFGSDMQVRFEVAPDLIVGIELSTIGQKVAWSVSDYLASLEKSVGALVNGSADDQSQRTSSPTRKQAESR